MQKTLPLPAWLKKEMKNEKNFLEYIVSKSLVKMQEYKKKLDVYEGKYMKNFKAFEKHINTLKKEDFAKWDDYIEWKGYQSAYTEWRKKYEEALQCIR